MFFYTFMPKLLNMSLTASIAIVIIMLLRVLLKKAPTIICYALWSIVLFRSLCPVTFTSAFSLFGFFHTPTIENSTMISRIEYIPDNIVHTEYPTITLPISGSDNVINHTMPNGREHLAADPLEAPMAITTYIWMTGVLVMVFYAVHSYLKLRRQLITASLLQGNIYLADDITSPFVMGLFFPKIYLPSFMSKQEYAYIILHEQHHIRRFDYIFKLLGYIALSIHWFNPLVWIAFTLANKDMEMSCDEAVVKKLGDDILADYTSSLLSLATGKHFSSGIPLAFGEVDAKGRIHNLINWKKPAFGVVVAAIITCAVLAFCLLTNPQAQKLPFELGTIQISWAKTMDRRPNEPTGFDLNDGELEELKSRLAVLKISKKDNDLAGFTPFYSISIQAGGYYFSLQGFDMDGEHVALYYQDDYYRIEDDDFSKYLRSICAGDARAKAENVQAAPTGEVSENKASIDVNELKVTLTADMEEHDREVYSAFVTEMLVTQTNPVINRSIKYSGAPYENYYAVADVDSDGKEELLINYCNASAMADMSCTVYDYDRNTGEIYLETGVFPHMTFYDNGYIKANVSHNHGRSMTDDFWPYELYKYEPEKDIYKLVNMIDMWQRDRYIDTELYNDFPQEQDLDGDGILYYDMRNYYNPDFIMDNAAYEEWCQQYKQANEIEITWYPIISRKEYQKFENYYYRDAKG